MSEAEDDLSKVHLSINPLKARFELVLTEIKIENPPNPSVEGVNEVGTDPWAMELIAGCCMTLALYHITVQTRRLDIPSLPGQ